jgi:hypothetical protein
LALGNPDDKARQKIESNIDSIVDIAERWLRRLERRRKQVKLATAILTFLVVFFAFGAFTVGYIIEEYSISFFDAHGLLMLSLIGLIGIGALAGGVIGYYRQGRSQDAKLKDLSNAINGIKKRDSQDKEPISVDVLSLVEKIMTVLPELVRKRNQDSFLFGLLAFVITVIPAKPPLALLIAVAVWLSFRYEMNKDYQKEVAKFEEQKRLFEQRKQEFLETL